MEEELRTIVEMSHDGIVILDEDHSVRFANTNASELTCYGIDELMGMDFLVLFSKKNRKAVTNMLEMKHSGQENVRFCSEFEILTSQGAKKETEICITNTINEKGARKSYVYIRDISERKRSEEELRKTEEKYRHLFERVQQGLFISTRQGKFVDCNQAMLDILGYDNKEEFLTLDIARDVYMNPEDRKIFQDLVEEKGFVKDFEVEFKRKDGRKVTILMTGNIIRDGDERIIGYEGINTDITERKNIEYELIKTNNFLRNLIESSVDGIITADIKGNILIFNEGAEKLLGYKAEDVIGKLHITKIYPPGVAREIMRKLRSTEFGGTGKLETIQSFLVGEDGEHIPINISAAIVYEEGKEVASIGIFTDLREKLRMERNLQDAQIQLLQSEKMSSLGKLAAGVAHEINNPLGGILIYSNLLMEEMEEGDPKREDLGRISEEATRCKEIVKSLLEFARQTGPKMEPIDINRAIDEGLFFLENQATFHNIHIKKHLDHAIPLIQGNSSQLKQVFMNMMVNAAEAMEGRGTLTVKTALLSKNGSVMIEFSDNGKGIPPEHVSKIFDPFFTTKEVGKGTGLGLSLSYGVIEQHKGKIDVKSKVGKGTSFTIELPVQHKDSQ
ncbi:MAG: PAS domain S-box protein [Thermodesulfobacteriota bacterium]|nr:PAS domain S-box protein [Thermodesulfobacteriota bacterium]